MDTAALNIDLKKHVCYSKRAEKIVRLKLSGKYPPAQAAKIFAAIQQKYAEYLLDLPYLGGAKCTHNGVGGTYDCIFICAYYEALGKTPPLNEIYEMASALFLPQFKRLGGFINLNRRSAQRLMSLAFRISAAKDQKLLRTAPGGYDMAAEPYDKAIGVRYHFASCPIAEFAKKHGLTEIMPAFCNGDYPAIAALHGALIRRHTCANSDICDYLIVGDKSAAAKQHPLKRDKNGYWHND